MDNQRLNNKVKQRDFKLNALLEITAAINANLSVSSLLEQYERVLREHLSIEKIILFTKDESWKCILRFGVQKGEIKEIISDDFFTASKEISLTTGRSRESFDLAIPIVQNGQTIAYVLAGDNSEQEIRMSPVIKHMRFIQTITNILVVAIQNRQLQEENIRQERIKKELELAAEMQAILLPHHLPKH